MISVILHSSLRSDGYSSTDVNALPTTCREDSWPLNPAKCRQQAQRRFDDKPSAAKGRTLTSVYAWTQSPQRGNRN